MSNREIPWTRLDPAKAQYGATEGAYINGQTLLALPSGNAFVIIGHCTCGTKESAENMARGTEGRGDRQVSRATLMSWFLK